MYLKSSDPLPVGKQTVYKVCVVKSGTIREPFVTEFDNNGSRTYRPNAWETAPVREKKDVYGSPYNFGISSFKYKTDALIAADQMKSFHTNVLPNGDLADTVRVYECQADDFMDRVLALDQQSCPIYLSKRIRIIRRIA